MKTLTVLVLALTAVLAFGVLGASASKSHKVATKVTIHYNGGTGPYYEEASFTGKVKSSKSKCQSLRVVKLKSGAAVVLAVHSSESGDWLVSASGGAAPGSYYAVAPKTRIGHTICKKGVSRTITIS